MTNFRTLSSTVAGAAVGLMMIAGQALAADAVVGQEEFRQHCAACHGMTGLGDGPIGDHLKTRPQNLATIADRNGGKFPFQRIYEIIDGRAAVAAHGSRDMPLWGNRYMREAGPVTPDQEEITRQLIEQRILSLVYYIGTLQ